KFDNPSGELRPGMFATAKVLMPGGENGIFVPSAAVARDKTTDSYQLFTVENGVARLKVVVTGEPDGDSIRILSGLAGNETVAAGQPADCPEVRSRRRTENADSGLGDTFAARHHDDRGPADEAEARECQGRRADHDSGRRAPRTARLGRSGPAALLRFDGHRR